jgi:hypothetical protein
VVLYLLAALSLSVFGNDVPKKGACLAAAVRGYRDWAAPENCTYINGMCHNNILPIMADLKRRGVPESKMRVLYVFPKSLGDYLHPLRTPVVGTSWRYHVILEVDGMMIDPDYGTRPVLMRPETYFRTMFGSGNISFDQMRVLSISPKHYRMTSADHGEGHFLHHLHEIEHPDAQASEDVATYLRRKSTAYIPEQTNVIQSQPASPYTSRIFALIEASRPRFEHLGVGREVVFDYSARPPKKVRGTIEAIGPRSARVRSGDRVEEYFYERIFSQSVQGTR